MSISTCANCGSRNEAGCKACGMTDDSLGTLPKPKKQAKGHSPTSGDLGGVAQLKHHKAKGQSIKVRRVRKGR